MYAPLLCVFAAAAGLSAAPPARITGHLTLPAHEGVLPVVKAEIIGDTESTVVCSTASTKFDCAVPSGLVSIRLTADGFAPRYLHNLRIAAGEVRDLGVVQLARGGSISGWVTIAAKNAAPEDVKVTLTPTYRTPARPDLPTLTASATKEGFFQFVSVPTGSYEVVARKSGWSAAHWTGITVGESGEVAIPRPLIITPLSTLDISVQPPVLDAVTQWRIAIDRIDASYKGDVIPIVEAALPVTGSYRRGRLEHGSYRVSILDTAGTAVARETVDVADELTMRTISVERIPIQGKVTLGDEPLQARLSFSWRDGSSAAFESNEDGEFRGALTHAGKWQVRITPKSSHLNLRTRSVTIVPRSDGEPARADIALPAGRLRGIVTDDQGAPASASVLLSRDGWIDATAAANSEGKFEFAGLDPGAVLVSALSSEGDSGLVPAAVTTDSHDEIRLTLQPRRHVHGHTVTTAGAAVAGVLLRYKAASAYQTSEASSGPNGDFEITVPKETAFVTIGALSPGFPAKLTSIALPPDLTDVNIILGGPWATLVVSLAGVPPWPAITPDMNGFLGLRFLNPPPSGREPFDNLTPDGFEYPIEAGTYVLCPDPRPSERCQQRALAAGSRVVVDARTFWSKDERAKIVERLP